jgi:hypothetical protein
VTVHSLTDDIVTIARPLIQRAARDGFREGMLEGKHETLRQLARVLDRAERVEDVRRWVEANRALLEEYRI